MKTISTEWTPEERLEAIYEIALALRSDAQKHGRADGQRTFNDADRLCHVAKASAHFLENNRKQILEGLQLT